MSQLRSLQIGWLPKSRLRLVDVDTLEPALHVIERYGSNVSCHKVLVRGRVARYFDKDEIIEWGALRGFEFVSIDEIDPNWLSYVKALRAYNRSVEILNASRRKIGFGESSDEALLAAALPQTPGLGRHKGFNSLDDCVRFGSEYLVALTEKLQVPPPTFGLSVEREYPSAEVLHLNSIDYRKTVICGIYFLIGEGQIKYVGQSVDILKRLREHQGQRRIKFERFSIIPVPQELLFDVESWYIRHFRPIYNKSRECPSEEEVKLAQQRVLSEARLRVADFVKGLECLKSFKAVTGCCYVPFHVKTWPEDEPNGFPLRLFVEVLSEDKKAGRLSPEQLLELKRLGFRTHQAWRLNSSMQLPSYIKPGKRANSISQG